MKKILIIDLTDKEIPLLKNEFVKPILKILEELKKIKIQYNTITFEELNNEKFENKLKEYDKIILSGTALKDFKYLEKYELFEKIFKLNVDILGICAGFHIIGKYFNCEFKENKRIGMEKIQIIKNNEIIKLDKNKSNRKNLNENEIENNFNLNAYELHKLSIFKCENIEIIAKNNEGFIEIFKIRNKDIYGVQFHPEVKNHFIIENFINI